VYVHSHDGGDKDWVEVNAHAVAFTLQDHVHLVELDSHGFVGSVTYQIRSFDRDNHLLSSSTPIPFSVANTQYIFDVSNH
jgi:hypothetical protein